jgi:hypothetical protein
MKVEINIKIMPKCRRCEKEIMNKWNLFIVNTETKEMVIDCFLCKRCWELFTKHLNSFKK